MHRSAAIDKTMLLVGDKAITCLAKLMFCIEARWGKGASLHWFVSLASAIPC